MSKERRRKERYETRLFAEVASFTSGQKLGRAVVMDVSLSGFGLETEADLTEGEEVECHIEIPLTFRAHVVRTIAEGQIKKYGLKFEGQSWMDKLILKKVLGGTRQTKKV